MFCSFWSAISFTTRITSLTSACTDTNKLVLNWLTKLQIKAQVAKSLVSTRASTRLMELCYCVPAASSKSSLSPALSATTFSLGIAPPFCYEAIVLFMSLSSSFLFINLVYYYYYYYYYMKKKCLKQLSYLGREEPWHPADLKCDGVQSFCPLLPFKWSFYDMLSHCFPYKREGRVTFPTLSLSKLTAVHPCGDSFFPSADR